MRKHTPGPWTVHRDWPCVVVPVGHENKSLGCASDPVREADGWCKVITRQEGEGEKFQAFHRTRVMKDEAKANARLIAAAPDLLAALSRLLSEIPTRRDWFDPDLEKICKLAVAKAEGRDA